MFDQRLISKRWSAVWMRLPRLIFDQSEFYNGDDNEVDKVFQNFGDHVFEKFLRSSINLFHIELGSFHSSGEKKNPSSLAAEG